MNAREHLRAVALGLAVVAAAGCTAAEDDGSAAQEGDLRPLERKVVGQAVDYEPDTTLRARLDELASSRRARREAAWAAVGRVLAPVKLADGDVKVGGRAPTIPTFRTWYEKDDFQRIFSKMYGDLSPEDRKARRPFTEAEAKAAFAWNATTLGSSTDEDYFARVKQLTDGASVDGLGGNHRVAYSPGLLTHLLEQYDKLHECVPKLASMKADDEPPSATNFAPCFGQEFPESAAVVKMSWYRATFGQERLPLPVYETNAATLAAKMKGDDADQGGWGKGVASADPDESKIYSVTMSDGTRFRMPAMHIVTKELREWLWITIWWSPKPDEDFGADRPAAIRRLPGPWANYKMNVVVAFEEKDPDPRGGYSGSLGDALAAAYTGASGPSWASNPYLEKGSPNAQSNCMGCHQHAGTNENSESILAAPDRFPMAARTKLRKNFPTDYLWAVGNAPERLVGVIEDQITHYDEVDR